MILREYRATYDVYVGNIVDDGIAKNNGYIIVKAETINDALDMADAYLRSHFNEFYRIDSLIQEKVYEFPLTNQ